MKSKDQQLLEEAYTNVDDSTFAEYTLALQIAKLSEEKVQKILEMAAVLKQIPNKTNEVRQND